jgi:hypothetical protein
MLKNLTQTHLEGECGVSLDLLVILIGLAVLLDDRFGLIRGHVVKK